MARSRQVILRLALAAGLIGAALGLFQARRHFIASFFVRGPGGAPAPRLGGQGPGLTPAARVRVVLIDGLGLGPAHALPALAARCGRGLDLRVDVGFPTVSLPIQSVLWTGLTQQQSGIQFVGKRLRPPPDGIPARVPDALALAESHEFIVESFGFGATRPRPDEVADAEARARWESAGFAAAARAEVASPRRLVFVHILRVDDAGHRHGAASPEYAAAARWADALLGGLVDAAPDARWLVLSDHGHRPAGGHGGAEDAIRVVRACLVEPAGGLGPAPVGRLVHLVDVARALADSVGVGLPAEAGGRPLAAALAAPESPGATLPTPPGGRLAIALVILAAALAATLVAARARVALLPWWWVVAYAAVVASEGVPSLSMRMIYPPLGQAMYLAALPGLAVLAVVTGLTTAARPIVLVVTQLGLPGAALAACLILSAGRPPLVPVWTAHASLLFVLGLSGCLVVALGLLAALVPSWFDRSRAAAARRGAP